MEIEDIDRVMAEVGRFEDEVLACGRTPEGDYVIRFEEADVVAEWDRDRRRLVLSSEIGRPPRSRTARIHEALLSFNLLWRDTGGLFMALAGRGGEVIQLFELFEPEIDARRIATVAANLESRRRLWRAYFDSEEADVVPQRPLASDEMIRA